MDNFEHLLMVMYAKEYEIEDPAVQAELVSHQDSAEDLVLRKEALSSLSTEAKEVVQLILNGPTEVLEALGSQKCYVHLGRLKTYLRKKWRKRQRVNQVMEELKDCFSGGVYK